VERALLELVERTYKELLLNAKRQKPLYATAGETQLRQMAYGAVLKILLYTMLEQELNLPSLADSGDPRTLMEEAWRRSRLEAFKPSWVDDALSLLASGGLRAELQRVAGILEKTPGDVLGRLYEALVPQEERRRLGEFYTPKPIAEFMVAWAVRDASSSVLDPGVGSGTFLVEAVQRLRSMGVEQPVERVVGVDVNPLAVLMATLNLLRVEPGSRPRVLLADFFDLSPLTLGYFSSVVCNPPYTRHHELSPEYKERIARVVESETGLRVSRLSSLYLHFFLHASTFLSEGGRLAFITPSEWMEASYGYPLRLLLKRSLRLRAILLFREDALAFPGVLTRACITLAERGKPAGRALLLELGEWPPTEALLEAVEGAAEGDLGWGRAKPVDPELLDPGSSWTTLPESGWAPPRGMVALGELAEVVRGIATGANEFFLLSEDETRRYRIEREFLRPAVPSARALAKLGLLIFRQEDWNLLRAKGEKVYLFWCRRRREELGGTKALEYIRMGEEKGYHTRYLTRHRREWWWLEQREPPDAFLIYMFRRGLRAVLNEAKALAPNTLHCVYFRQKEHAKAVLAYLNSSTALELAQHRVYGGGLRKLEPGEAEKIPVPDPRLLSEAELETLATLLDELDEAERKGLGEQARKALDEEVRRILKRL
jgi:hypothetical protein